MDNLSMDISGINFDMPKKWKIELWLKKARECLSQLTELEDQLEKMEAPRSYEAEHKKFKSYWRVYYQIDKLYKWMRTMELSNYPSTSVDDLKGYIEYWECEIEQLNEGEKS